MIMMIYEEQYIFVYL